MSEQDPRNNPVAADDDDAEGHMKRSGSADSEAAEDDDTEGHMKRSGS